MYILPLSSSLTNLYYLYNFLLCFCFLFIKLEDLIPWSVRFLPTLSGTLPRLNKYINENQFWPRWSSPIPPTPVSYNENTKHNTTNMERLERQRKKADVLWPQDWLTTQWWVPWVILFPLCPRNSAGEGCNPEVPTDREIQPKSVPQAEDQKKGGLREQKTFLTAFTLIQPNTSGKTASLTHGYTGARAAEAQLRFLPDADEQAGPPSLACRANWVLLARMLWMGSAEFNPRIPQWGSDSKLKQGAKPAPWPRSNQGEGADLHAAASRGSWPQWDLSTE